MIVDSHRLYSAFLDALNAGSSPDEVADICAEALNRAKISYEAEQRNAKQREKEAAADSLFSALQTCGTAFDIPELAKTSDAAKDEFINFMDSLRDILNLVPTAPEEEETTEEDSDNILRSFISSLY
jgi:hypothetical protein